MRESTAAPAGNEVALWALLVLAFSPVLVDLAAHVAAEPWTWYSIPFLVLFAAETGRCERRRPRRLMGLCLVGSGIAIELVLVIADWVRFARPGLLLGLLGLSLSTGRWTPRVSALLLWAIPVPHGLLRLLHPEAVAALLEPALGLVEALGGEARLRMDRGQQFLAEIGRFELPIEPSDAGVPLGLAVAGALWWAGIRRAEPAGRVARWLVLAVPSAVLAQMVCLSLATALAGGGRVDTARSLLDVAAPAVAVLGTLWVAGSGASSR